MLTAVLHSLENLMRIPRAGIGASWDGIKPTGSVPGPKVIAADDRTRT